MIIADDPQTLSQAEKRGETFAANWPLPPGATLKDLRALSAAQILRGEPDYIASSALIPNLGITVDGYVFPKKPADVFAAGKQHPVALLLGSTSRDRITGILPADLKKAIADEYGPIAARAQSLYASSSDSNYGTPDDQWDTDKWFRCPAMAQSMWHAAAGSPTYQYEFTRVPIGGEAFGAFHGAEIPYVFGELDRGLFRAGSPIRANAVDARVAEAMQQYWTNFAKTGDPNGAGLPVWPKFDPATRAYIQFTDVGPVAKEGLRRPYCDLFIEHVKRRMAQ